MVPWGFYGRRAELQQISGILNRGRWFFAKISGRRRIGKTSLVQEARREANRQKVVYIQVPDSDPAGVMYAVRDFYRAFSIPVDDLKDLRSFALSVEKLVRQDYVVAIDEFQYFNRSALYEFTSHLQLVVDRLSQEATPGLGGLIVLGSLHTELAAILEDRSAPLFNRVTDNIDLQHLDVASVLEILRNHAEATPDRLLFLWNLFEGVPKYYRDCYEQGALAADRKELLEKMFFLSSSPLRSEADSWFLRELRGRYDLVLKFVAEHPGCSNNQITAHAKSVEPEGERQVGGYIKVLREKYNMIERRQPVFAKPKERNGRFYLRDNFLRAWLAALAVPSATLNFRPVAEVIADADNRLETAEGHGLERLVRTIYEERSRKNLGDFALTEQIQGYWDRSGTEIDLIVLDGDSRAVRFGSCKRNPDRLVGDLGRFDGHIARFLALGKRFDGWRIEKVAIAPALDEEHRRQIERAGYLPQDLDDLTRGL